MFTFGSIIALMLVTAYVTVEVCTHVPFRLTARCPFGTPDGVWCARGVAAVGCGAVERLDAD